MKIVIWAICGAAVAGFIAFANEVGRFCEETNPYQGIPADEREKDCNGCMGAAFGDCDRCENKQE